MNSEFVPNDVLAMESVIGRTVLVNAKRHGQAWAVTRKHVQINAVAMELAMM